MKNSYNSDFIVQFDEQLFVDILNNNDFPVYTGENIVAPRVEEQYLSTAGTTMLSNITILQIPFSDVANTSGGTTVTIG